MKLSTGGSITSVLGEDFAGLKAELGEHNILPDYLAGASPGGVSFANVSKQTWREISCAPERGFIDESQIRNYMLDFLLDELKDPRTPLLQECECYRDGAHMGRCDYFIRVAGKWIAVEAKLNIRCEKDLLSQVTRYVNVSFFIPEKGQHTGKRFEDASPLCLIGDQHGLYLTEQGRFIIGETYQPAWKREELTPDATAEIRSRIIKFLGAS